MITAARAYFERARVSDRVRIERGYALEVIPRLNETFDLVFIDAVKEEYEGYLDLALPKLRHGGVVVCDNLLWGGQVAGEGVLRCAGLRPNGVLEAWYCYSITMNSGPGDLALLSLRLASPVPADGYFRTLSLSTRVPAPGEHLNVVGVRFREGPGSVDPVTGVTDAVEGSGLMFVSSGAAGAFSFPAHDSVLAPYPTIEILSGTFGGMSGGAVLDTSGAVVGIISRGWRTDDREGPTLAAWWTRDCCGARLPLGCPALMNRERPCSKCER